MKLQLISDADGVARVSCEGTIAHESFSRGADPMSALMGPGIFAKTVLFDLQKTDYIDSSGISWLLVCQKYFAQLNGRLILHSVPPAVTKVLQLVQLPKIIPVAADEADALKLIKG